MRTFTSSKTYGPIEFFFTVMASDNIAPQHGNHKLEDFLLRRQKNNRLATKNIVHLATSAKNEDNNN